MGMNGKRLLVIDDEPEFGEFVRKVAEGLDYRVEVTTRADQFKRVYAEFDPTVVVLDVVMPDIEGVELVQWLAEQHCTSKLLVITGYNPYYAEVTRTLGQAKGLSRAEIFTKPIGLAELRAALS